MRKVGLVLVLTFLLLFTVFTVFWNVALVRGVDFITINADGSIAGTSNIVSGDNATYTLARALKRPDRQR